jgi:hypothetical protein
LIANYLAVLIKKKCNLKEEEEVIAFLFQLCFFSLSQKQKRKNEET